MDIYYSTFVYQTGGRERYRVRRVVTTAPDDLVTLYEMLRAKDKVAVWIVKPPMGPASTRVKAIPHLMVRESLMGEVEKLGGIKIPDGYLWYLIYDLKRQFYELGNERTETADTYYRLKIRSKVIELLESGDWIDDPTDEESWPDPDQRLKLQFLNKRIEKIDLGQRKDLKFSSDQDPDWEKPSFGPKVEHPLGEQDPEVFKWLSSTKEERISMQEADSFFLFKLKKKGYTPEIS